MIQISFLNHQIYFLFFKKSTNVKYIVKIIIYIIWVMLTNALKALVKNPF